MIYFYNKFRLLLDLLYTDPPLWRIYFMFFLSPFFGIRMYMWFGSPDPCCRPAYFISNNGWMAKNFRLILEFFHYIYAFRPILYAFRYMHPKIIENPSINYVTAEREIRGDALSVSAHSKRGNCFSWKWRTALANGWKVSGNYGFQSKPSCPRCLAPP